MTTCLSTYRLSAENTSISRAITSGVRTGVWKAANLDLSDQFPFLNVRFFPFREVKRFIKNGEPRLNSVGFAGRSVALSPIDIVPFARKHWPFVFDG